MKDLNQFEKGWIIGMLEGEATIGAWLSNQNRDIPSAKTVKYARVEVSSVDHEVLYKLQELTGLGIINEQIKARKGAQHCKTWRIAKAEEVIQILCLMGSSPFLSEHRKEQIIVAVDAASATIARKQSGESYERKNARRGENQSNSKLTDVDVRKIKDDSRSSAKIAVDYGVSKETIRRIKTGVTWTHV